MEFVEGTPLINLKYKSLKGFFIILKIKKFKKKIMNIKKKSN